MSAYLTPVDMDRLEGAATNLRDKLLVRALFHLGCRVTEAVSIEVKDVDLATGTVTILHLKTRVRATCPHWGTPLARAHAFCPR